MKKEIKYVEECENCDVLEQEIDDLKDEIEVLKVELGEKSNALDDIYSMAKDNV